jgi:hypothetical protein
MDYPYNHLHYLSYTLSQIAQERVIVLHMSETSNHKDFRRF